MEPITWIALSLRNNQVIGSKRATVEIKGNPIPKRNPPKPNWIKFKK